MSSRKSAPAAENSAAPAEHDARPGSPGFAVLLLALGVVALSLSLELWSKMREPRIASAAALPLFASALWVVTALLTVAEQVRRYHGAVGGRALRQHRIIRVHGSRNWNFRQMAQNSAGHADAWSRDFGTYDENLCKQDACVELRGVALTGALGFALPPNVLAALVGVILFCALLLLGVSFYLAALLFLYAAMCFLTRGEYGKNLLRAVFVTALFALVFRGLFRVVFP